MPRHQLDGTLQVLPWASAMGMSKDPHLPPPPPPL